MGIAGDGSSGEVGIVATVNAVLLFISCFFVCQGVC